MSSFSDIDHLCDDAKFYAIVLLRYHRPGRMNSSPQLPGSLNDCPWRNIKPRNIVRWLKHLPIMKTRTLGDQPMPPEHSMQAENKL